jgi:SAM-dependent methyltransferase
MSGKEGAAPEAIRVDPEGQMRYLGTEEVTGKGLFYPSRLEEILPALRATLRPERTFLDLGSGDGRVVFLAAVLGARATGIEYDRALHRVAREARRRLAGVVDPARAALRRGDFFALDLDRYDVLFYFGSGSYSEPRLFEKIAREMRPGSVFLLAHGREDSLPPLPLLATYGVVRIYAPPPR